jgi:hypothetical protein
LTVYTNHGEDSALPGFTGAGPQQRMVTKGYPSNPGYSEFLDFTRITAAAGTATSMTMNEARGALSMRNLLTTVYHQTSAFWPGRDGGVGHDYRTSSVLSGGATWSLEDYHFGALTGWAAPAVTQKLGSGNIATYPCAAASYANASWSPAYESPNPFPEITSASVVYGTPVYFKADAGSTLVVTAATVTKVSDGSVLALRQLSKANDPAAEIGDNEVFLVPTTALAVGASYSVSATGTLNGTAFTKTFMFSTAP